MNIFINCDFNKNSISKDYDFFVGVDQGCNFFYRQNKKFDLAIGDFDSFDSLKIKKLAQKIIYLKQEKDFLDLEYCLNYLYLKFTNQILKIDLFVPKNRIEFDFNLILLLKNFPNIYVYGDNFLMFKLKKNNNFCYLKYQEYCYFSIVCLKKGKVKIKNFKYSGCFKMNFLNSKFFSNKMIKNKNGTIQVVKGCALIVLTKKN